MFGKSITFENWIRIDLVNDFIFDFCLFLVEREFDHHNLCVSLTLLELFQTTCICKRKGKNRAVV